jgi:hypothetical protein
MPSSFHASASTSPCRRSSLTLTAHRRLSAEGAGLCLFCLWPMAKGPPRWFRLRPQEKDVRPRIARRRF